MHKRLLIQTPLLRCLAALLLTSCAAGPAPEAAAQPAPRRVETAPPSPTEPPRLIVLITVDQLRADYYDRFKPQLTGGLRRLYEGGAVFTHAYQDHANTETAPGHASTLSGRFPRSTGIVSNLAGVADPQAPLVGGLGAGASPFRFRGSTLIDWMRVRDPRVRALSVSTKDRGAILPLGRAKQQAYWYAGRTGTFVTSTYYADTLPQWVRAFNARRLPASFTDRTWALLLDPSKYPEPDSVPVEALGVGVVFPHRMPADTAQALGAIPGTPWMDDITVALALEGVRSLKLGGGDVTDVLAVSLSATDYIGHAYGPYSREIHDQILRLDRAIGALLDSLAAMVPASRTVVALTGDHGVAPLPGTGPRGTPAGSAVDLRPYASHVRQSLAARGADSLAFRFEDGTLYVDRESLTRSGVPVDSLVRAFGEKLRRDSSVYRIHYVRDLARDAAKDVSARRWLQTLPPDLPIELVVTLRPYDLWAPVRYAQHGSPHDYDAHVPLVFHGAPFRAGRYQEMARTVDLGVTLAWTVGAVPTEPVDGRVLKSAVR